MTEVASTSEVRRAGAIIGLVGGALILGGCFLPWVRTEGASVGEVVISGDVSGLDLSLGVLIAAAGGLAIILALVTMLTLRRGAYLLGAGLVIASIAAGIVAIVYLSDLNQAYTDFAITQARQAGQPTDGVDVSIQRLIELGTLHVEAGPGLWLTIAGAVFALIGGLLVLLGGSRQHLKRDTSSLLPV
jgi:hypothetical protein